MRSGQLRERVTLQAASTATDSYGQPIETWSSASTVWADVRYRPGGEGDQPPAGQEVARNRYDVRIRYNSSLNLTVIKRLVWESRVLDIEHIENVGNRNHEYALACREVVGDTAVVVEVEIETGNPIGLLLALTYS